MKHPNHKTPREFAVDVVVKLRSAGFEALWAGGCVRDQLLGLTPKDYDVATSARPDDIRRVFGERRTLPIGAAFGVITVVGTKSAGQIEVATFRQDATYSDGRHPDSVTFSTAKADAHRRDFTINGLFFDPVAGEVIDYVDGQKDLSRKIVRAIGDPYERIAEDKLRMLRAVRFAATFKFRIEEKTQIAVREQATEISVVSAERIASEMRRMLVHETRRTAVELLRDSDLLQQILPESVEVFAQHDRETSGAPWHVTLRVLEQIQRVTFEVALAGLLREIHVSHNTAESESGDAAIKSICRRWKLSNDETSGVAWLLEKETLIRQASTIPWPTLQRLLIAERVGELLDYCEAVADVIDGDSSQIRYCREKLAIPADQLNPTPLIDGDDLKTLEIPQGPAYARILRETRNAQLDGQVANKATALDFARSRWEAISNENKIND